MDKQARIEILLTNASKAGSTIEDLKKASNALNKEIEKLPKNSDEFVKRSKQLQEVNGTLNKTRNEVKGVTQASDVLKTSWAGVLNQIPGFSAINGALSQAKGGVGGLISSMGVLRTAIAATGVGLLVLAIGSLVLAFSKFAPLVDKVEQAMSGLGKVVDVIVNRLINVGKAMWDIINGDFSGGIDKISHSFDGMSTAMKDAYTAGVELKKLQQDLEDAARGLEIANTRAEKQIEKLIIQSKNKSTSDKEQIELLKQARDIANKNFKDNDAQREKEFQALIEEAKLKSQLSEDEILQLTAGTLAQEIEYEKRGTIEDALLDKIKEAQIERINAAGQTSKLLEKIQNAEDARLEKQQAAREKNIEQQQKENDQFLKDQEKFNEQKNKIQEKQDLFEQSRLEANLEKEKQRAKDSMLAALDAIKKRNDAAKQDIIDQQAIADAENAIQQEKLDVFNEGTSSFIALLSTSTAARKRNANEIKALESGQVIINGISEVSEIAKTFAKLGPIGQVLAAFKIAFSVARTVAGVARINAQKFELGGAIYGPRHSQGGVPIEAEGGEFMFSRKAVNAIGMRTLSAINNRYTRKLEAGGPINPFTDASRGPIARSASAQSVDSLSGMNDLNNNFLLFAGEVRDWQRNLKVVNNLQDTEKGLTTLNQLRDEANV